jgi:putative protease
VCRRGYEVTDLETGSQLVVDNKYIMSPRDLCSIEFMDRIIDAGVTVFKIEGRARSSEYVKTVTQAYREAADAVEAGTYTPEFAAALKSRLETVFNRGFWDGYYLGAKMGQWSEVYGNRATRMKRYVGKVTNYFEKIGVAEILMETGKISVGDTIVISGPTTGVYEGVVPEIRVDLKPVQQTVKGDLCSIPVPLKLRRSDKVYLFETVRS